MAKLDGSAKMRMLKTLNNTLRKAKAELNSLYAKTRLRLKEDGHKTMEIEYVSSTPDVGLSSNVPMAKKMVDDLEAIILKLEKTGIYGECIDCGEEISQGRLLKNIAVYRCIDCQTALEEKEKRINKCRGHVKGSGLLYT